MFDVIVLGKGPAGIQAAVYIKRANLSVLIIGKDGGALANLTTLPSVTPARSEQLNANK